MSTKKPARLGRGLSSLMATPVPVHVAPPGSDAKQAPGAPAAGRSRGKATKGASAGVEADAGSDVGVATDGERAGGAPEGQEGLRWIAVGLIEPNRHQPRQRFEEGPLRRLADSIRSEGMMQPIVLRPAGDSEGAGRFEIVAGERRWRAAKLAGLDRVPALLKELDDRQLAEWALIENLQREDLNPIERATAFEQLGQAFGLRHDAIAERVGIERSTVTNLLRLLRLAPPVREMVSRGTLSMGQARALAGLEDGSAQSALAERAVREEWTVRRVEAEVRRHQAGEAAPLGSAPAGSSGGGRSAHLTDLERQIGEQLGTKVKLRAGRKKGTGTLAIDFYDIDQFDDLLGKLGVKAD